MPPSNTRSSQSFQNTVGKLQPGVAFVVTIFGALIAFEIFNYTTTDHALADLLGDLTFAGMRWSTILAIAFCGIDFAGIARLFTPEQGMDEPKEVWYLFGAWLLAATMNAILTWWGVSLAVANHSVQSSTVIDPATITLVVPVFVAIMVWVIRILIIGTLSLAIDRLLHPGIEQRPAIQQAINAARANHSQPQPMQTQPMHIPSGLNSSSASPRTSTMPRPASPANPRFSSRAAPADNGEDFVPETPVRQSRPEPTYHSIGMSARPPVNTDPKNDNTGANRYRR